MLLEEIHRDPLAYFGISSAAFGSHKHRHGLAQNRIEGEHGQ